MKFQSDQEDRNFHILIALNLYARFLKAFFFGFPFIVLAWYCFIQFLAGVPEPTWWLNLERAIGVTW